MEWGNIIIMLLRQYNFFLIPLQLKTCFWVWIYQKL